MHGPAAVGIEGDRADLHLRVAGLPVAGVGRPRERHREDAALARLRQRLRKRGLRLLLRGYAHTPIRNVRITDCTFDNVEKEDVVEGVARLTLTNVSVNGKRRTETISR